MNAFLVGFGVLSAGLLAVLFARFAGVLAETGQHRLARQFDFAALGFTAASAVMAVAYCGAGS